MLKLEKNMRIAELDWIKKYRRMYPDDVNNDKTILNVRESIRKDTRYLDIWLFRQTYEGQLTEKELKEGVTHNI